MCETPEQALSDPIIIIPDWLQRLGQEGYRGWGRGYRGWDGGTEVGTGGWMTSLFNLTSVQIPLGAAIGMKPHLLQPLELNRLGHRTLIREHHHDLLVVQP